jgi:gliding motility-associated-like protein
MKINKYIILIFLLIGFTGFLSAQTQVLINAANNGNTYDGCNFLIYDSGGPFGDYSNSENYSVTICNPGGSTIILDIISFNLEQNFDYLYIYDGPTTGSPQIIQATGQPGIQGQTFESTGSCITIRFTSDGSVVRPGFEIAANCGQPCQDFTIDIVSTNPAITNMDSLWIDVCPNQVITFTAEGNYPNNNTDYFQSDANVNWVWSSASGLTTVEQSGVGLTEFTHNYTQSGGYFLSLVAFDTNGCSANLLDQYRVRVSMPPIWGDITADQTVICPGEPVNFSGSVTSDLWVMPITETQIVQECITDDQGVVQEFCWDVAAFQPGQLITSGTDLESVCMVIEHSWVADMDIYIQCPNGQQAMINEYNTGSPCTGTYFGEPDHSDNCNPGVGYEYCWSMNATQSHVDICAAVTIIPEDTYLPFGTFNDLIGCPINGEWCVVVIDDWGGDDGTLFQVELNFNESIIPADVWSISHTYEDEDIVWTGDGMNANQGGDATANPTTSGNQTFTFSVTDDFGCTYTQEIDVLVLPYDDPTCCAFPTANAGPDSHVCSNTFTFNASLEDGNTGEWAVVSGPGNANFNSITSPNATVTVDAWGVYEFSWTEQNLSPTCSDTDNIIVEFWPIPTTTFTFTPILCNSDQTTITYTGNVGAGANYTWGFDGGTAVGAGQGPYQVSWADAGIHTVSLTVSENGCTSDDTTVNILNPGPIEYDLVITNDPCFGFCEGSATANVTGGSSPYIYTWDSGNPVYNNLCAGDYYFEVIDANGCTNGESFTITEPLELIVLDTIVEHVLCHGNAEGSVFVEVVGGSGELDYIWHDDPEEGFFRENMYAGYYVLNIRDENACNIEMSFVITQPDELLLTIVPDMAVCEGEQVSIQSNAMGGISPYAFYWDRGEGYEIGGSTLTTVMDQTTTFYSYVEDLNGCISDTVSMSVLVSPELVIDSIMLTHNRCYNSCDGAAQLVVLGGLEPLDYSWGSQNYIWDGLCAGAYNVTVSDLIGCSVAGNFVITEPNQLTYSADITPATCFGYDDGEIQMHVQGGTPPYSYIWPDGNTESIHTATAGTYPVTVSDVNNCRIITSFTITQPSKIIATQVGDRTICIGGTTTLTAQATGGTPYYDFRWTGSDGSVYPVNSAVVSPDENTVYTLIVTDSLGCLSNPLVVNVNLYPELEILSLVTSYGIICEGDPAIIQADVVGGNGGPYYMTLQDGRVVSSPFTVYPTETTMYYLTLRDNCGTPAVLDSIEITVRPKPANVFTAQPVQGCPPLNVSFQEISPNVGQTYLWNFGDGGFSEAKNPTYVYNKAGNYDVTLEVRDIYGCKSKRTREKMIEVNRNPIASFIPEPEIVSMVNAEIYFENKSDGADYYYWFFGDGDSSNFVSPRHVFPYIGEYEVMLVAETYHACRDTAYRTVIVGNEFTFYAPTSFTPNGDGTNDCFRVCGNGIDKNSFKLSVYDRWGNRVFETDKFVPDVDCDACGTGSWDGTNNGNRMKGDEVLSNGLYKWYAEFADWNGTVFKKSGSVYLLR